MVPRSQVCSAVAEEVKYANVDPVSLISPFLDPSVMRVFP